MKRLITNIKSRGSTLCLTTAMALLSNFVTAQVVEPVNTKMQAIATPDSRKGWVHFSEGTTIDPQTIFVEYRDAFELSADDDMRIRTVKTDELGMNHYKYDQYYKNVRVQFGEFIVHQQADGFVKSANGRLITGLNLQATPSVSEEIALSAALNFMKAKRYLWESEAAMAELRRSSQNPNATYYPEGELVFAPSNYDATYLAQDYRLAWKFKIYTDDIEVDAQSVYVDAINGKVILSSALSMNCSTGSGTSAFNGAVNIYTYWTGSNYRSRNDCQATDIYVYNCSGGGQTNTFYTDADNSWTNTSAIQCQWGAQQTYSYYSNVHSRASWDDASGDMIAYNNANAGQNNACWGCTGNSTIFYAGNTSSATDDWNTNDIVGHEFTHGVTQDESGLDYNKESGALNESFSDIFGEMVESWSEGNCDYLCGADRGAIRSFITPNTYNDPDTYLGTNWYNTVGCTPAGGSGGNDYCGVHTNSGVQNHWFYLLAEGGSGTNDNGTTYNVTGIDRFDARAIAYRSNVLYLTSSSGYIDARAGSLDAASDLFGTCSQEYTSTGEAWYAVGVGPSLSYYNNDVCGTWPVVNISMSLQGISTITGGNGCTTTIVPSTGAIYFSARNRVRLYPGFTAQSGSHFTAYINPCAVSYHKGETAVMSDAEKGYINQAAEQQPDQVKSVAYSNIVKASPNPFDNTLTISFNLQNDAPVKVRLYDAVGKLMNEFENFSSLSKGEYGYTYDTSDLQPGFYFINVEINGKAEIVKVVKM